MEKLKQMPNSPFAGISTNHFSQLLEPDKELGPSFPEDPNNPKPKMPPMPHGPPKP